MHKACLNPVAAQPSGATLGADDPLPWCAAAVPSRSHLVMWNAISADPTAAALKHSQACETSLCTSRSPSHQAQGPSGSVEPCQLRVSCALPQAGAAVQPGAEVGAGAVWAAGRAVGRGRQHGAPPCLGHLRELPPSSHAHPVGVQLPAAPSAPAVIRRHCFSSISGQVLCTLSSRHDSAVADSAPVTPPYLWRCRCATHGQPNSWRQPWAGLSAVCGAPFCRLTGTCCRGSRSPNCLVSCRRRCSRRWPHRRPLPGCSRVAPRVRRWPARLLSGKRRACRRRGPRQPLRQQQPTSRTPVPRAKRLVDRRRPPPRRQSQMASLAAPRRAAAACHCLMWRRPGTLRQMQLRLQALASQQLVTPLPLHRIWPRRPSAAQPRRPVQETTAKRIPPAQQQLPKSLQKAAAAAAVQPHQRRPALPAGQRSQPAGRQHQLTARRPPCRASRLPRQRSGRHGCRSSWS